MGRTTKMLAGVMVAGAALVTMAPASAPAAGPVLFESTVVGTAGPLSKIGATGPVATGIVVGPDNPVSITASGIVNICDPGTPQGAINGCPAAPFGEVGPNAGVFVATVNMPLFSGNLAGALIYSTDGGATWLFAGEGPITVTQPGELLLAVNDDDYRDNSGAFTIAVQSLLEPVPTPVEIAPRFTG